MLSIGNKETYSNMPSKTISLGKGGGQIIIKTEPTRSSRSGHKRARGASALSEYNLLQMALAGKVKPKQVRSLYRGLSDGTAFDSQVNCKPKYDAYGDVTGFNCKSSKSRALQALLARDDEFDFDGLGGLGGHSRSKAARLAFLGIDLDDDEDVGDAGAVGGTFNHLMFNPKPDTEKPETALWDSNKWCSKNVEDFYETNKHECAKPNYRLVFYRLHAKNSWMKLAPVREQRYRVWRDKMYEVYKGNDDAIMEKFKRIIKGQDRDGNEVNPPLNPSERTGGASSSSSKRCPDDMCFFRVNADGTGGDCDKPNADDYVKTFKPRRWNDMSELAAQNDKFRLREQFNKLSDKEKCSKFPDQYRYDRSGRTAGEFERFDDRNVGTQFGGGRLPRNNGTKWVL